MENLHTNLQMERVTCSFPVISTVIGHNTIQDIGIGSPEL